MEYFESILKILVAVASLSHVVLFGYTKETKHGL